MLLVGHVIDGQLASWPEVAALEDWRDLLLGNGLSSHIWPGFAYDSLYEHACKANVLNRSDRKLFETNPTINFESVLAGLATTIQTLETLKESAAGRLRTRYLRVQQALGAAVRDVHIALSDLPVETREIVRDTLRDYRWVFTTSYDLVLYWCAGYGDSFEGFVDYFFCNGRLEFHPENTKIKGELTQLAYLHGALHLLVDEKGVTRKRRSSAASLLAQFGSPDHDDPLARPLLIAEGKASEKVRIIKDNEYLSFALDRLSRGQRGLVVFGLSLRDEDGHLVSALNARPKRPVAVGLRPRTKTENRRRQAHVRKILDADELYFFDATTHPLGEATPCRGI
jgi:Domain of unknown function (DUF4917)